MVTFITIILFFNIITINVKTKTIPMTIRELLIPRLEVSVTSVVYIVAPPLPQPRYCIMVDMIV